jgi:rhodanese-related sulfurtransferase
MTLSGSGAIQEIGAFEAEQLVETGDVRVLDVRTPGEYLANGHIPGALLLPVDLIASAPATLPRDGKPLLVYCEHGIRSVHASRFLARAGFSPVLNMTGGMSRWTGIRERTPVESRAMRGPSGWILQCADLLPRGGRVLDVACGAGRNALLLAGAGFPVHAVDRDEQKIQALAEISSRLRLPLTAEVMDLETDAVDLGDGVYDLILVMRFLHRPLFPVLSRALRPSGLLLYETFTVDQARRGKPSRPEFLLQRGELPVLVEPLEILRRREGDYEGGLVSAVAASRSPDSGNGSREEAGGNDV